MHPSEARRIIQILLEHIAEFGNQREAEFNRLFTMLVRMMEESANGR